MHNQNKMCHLQMIEGIINRMGQNSFQIKGWSIGIMIAIFSFAKDQSNIRCILFTILPLCVMWILDTYYLVLERKYRFLYDYVRGETNEINFDMNFNTIKLDIGKHYKIPFIRVLISTTEILFYLTCIVTTILIYKFA